MSYVLRHGAIKEGIEITPDGWVSIMDLLGYLKTTREMIQRVVSEDNKNRFEINGDLIRAAQGHSMVVSPEAMEATWSKFEGLGTIFHGTNIDALTGIAEKGMCT
jgi:RNA:NAD 2'-phosphotransferase (TPT1/KptA family)